MPEISVIVPVYRVEPYIRRCVDSILDQTFGDFELILVDDGSPDDSGAICDGYADADARVHAIHQKNGGLSAARNVGLDYVFAHSDSRWVTFIDSDDWVLPRYLEALREGSLLGGNCIAATAYIETTGNENILDDGAKPVIWRVGEYYKKRQVNATVSCCKLYPRNCFEGLRFPIGVLHEDEYITYRILFEFEHVAVVDSPLYAYFRNTQGITKGTWTVKRLTVAKALEEQVAFFEQSGFEEIAHMRFESYLRWNMKAQDSAIHCDSLSAAEKRKYVRELKRQMRRMILRYRKKGWVSLLRRGKNRRAVINAFVSNSFFRWLKRHAALVLKR